MSTKSTGSICRGVASQLGCCTSLGEGGLVFVDDSLWSNHSTHSDNEDATLPSLCSGLLTPDLQKTGNLTQLNTLLSTMQVLIKLLPQLTEMASCVLPPRLTATSLPFRPQNPVYSTFP